MPVSYPVSADVVADTTATAAQYNNLRRDAVESRVVSLVAGENLTALDAVYVKAADGRAYKTDADAEATSVALGLVISTVTTGNTASILCLGYMDGLTGLTHGALYYTTGTAGAIANTMTATYAAAIGVAISSTTMLVLPNAVRAYHNGELSVAGLMGVGTTVATNIALKVGGSTASGGNAWGIAATSSLNGTSLGAGVGSLVTLADNCTNFHDFEANPTIASGKTVANRYVIYAANKAGSGTVAQTYFARLGSEFMTGVTTHSTPTDEIRVVYSSGGSEYVGYITINN